MPEFGEAVNMEKVTLDLDFCKESYAMYRIFQLKSIGAVDIYSRTSSSGDGFHIKAYFKELPMNRYKLRLLLGDDPKRVEYELKNNSFKNGVPTMWDKKPLEFHDKRAGNWFNW